jgi:hypothetical protein
VEKTSNIVTPYYTFVRGTLVQRYHAYVLPAYTTSLPYIQSVYNRGYSITVNTGLPYARWAGQTIAVFFERRIFPQVRLLYGENVEPQLVRIGERLGRYRDGRKLKAAVDDVDR